MLNSLARRSLETELVPGQVYPGVPEVGPGLRCTVAERAYEDLLADDLPLPYLADVLYGTTERHIRVLQVLPVLRSGEVVDRSQG